MSDVVEKTLTALPSLLALDSTQQPSSGGKLSSASKLGQLIRAITELTSKHEEEKLVKRELVSIKEQVSSPNTSMRQMKELMVRAIYCEMLGYQASFSYIHAIKLAQQGNVLEKRVGYLAVSLFLHEGHELLLLLVNTVLKDLQSTNLIEVCMALTVVSQMFPKDMIPAILPLVEEKLTHPKEIIRRKAVLALYKFYLVAPNQVQHIHNKFRKALCDKDPGVMSASLHIYLQMIQENPEPYKELTGSFVTILKQVVGGKLPLDFNYHSVPGPWLQIQLLTILALLGKNDHSTSQMMYEVLDESLQRAEMNHNITYAILYECVKAIYTIHPKTDLLEKAAKCIGNFVLSPKINLKYLGLKALTYVVQQDVKLALQHQMTIIECLDHSDDIIKRETLELLYRITNEQNVIVIVEKMLDFLQLCRDEYTVTDLVGKVAELAEKYAPDNSWFIQTMNTVFTLGGDSMLPDLHNNFLRLLSDGTDSVEDTELRTLAVDSYVSLLQEDAVVHTLPQPFLQVISWVLGEYSPLVEGLQTVTVLRLLLRLLDMKQSSSDTRIWALAAMCKLQCGGPTDLQGLGLGQGQGMGLGVVQDVCERYAASLDTVLRQKVHELQVLGLEEPELRARVLSPPPRGLVPLEVDSSLSFLDGFVSEALAAGAAPYKPPHQRREELTQNKVNLEPYSLSLPVSLSADGQSPSMLSVSSGLSGNSTEVSHTAGCGSGLKLDGVRRVWGREGCLQSPPPPPGGGEEEVPCSPPPPPPGGAPGSPDSTSGAGGPQQEKRQQLASSLFVGLGSSQSSVCLMGRSEPTPPQRFPRGGGAKGQGSSTVSSHSSNDSTVEDRTDTPQHAHPAVDTPPTDTQPSHPALEDPPPTDPRRHDHASVAPPPTDPRHTHPALDQGDLSRLRRSDIVPLGGGGSGSVSVSGCHVYGEDDLLLLLFLSNASDAPVPHVQLDVSSSQLQVCSVSSAPLGVLQAHSVEVCQYSLVMETPAARVSLSVNVSYQPVGGELQSQSFTYDALSLADFIRPFPVTTEEYGSMWLSLSHDTRQNLSVCQDTGDPLTATLTLLRDRLQLHLVDIIGSEGIAACRLLRGQPCLIHCRIHGDGLAVWLRSPVPELPDCVLYHCQRVLAQDLS